LLLVQLRPELAGSAGLEHHRHGTPAAAPGSTTCGPGAPTLAFRMAARWDLPDRRYEHDIHCECVECGKGREARATWHPSRGTTR
jgi:hypothetical protein